MLLLDNSKNKMSNTNSSENPVVTIGRLGVIRTILTERNFLNFPFNALSDKDVQRRTKEGAETHIEYRKNDTVFKGKIAIRPNAHYGFPPPKDYRIRKAIEYLLTKNGYPVPQYFGFTGYAICKVLGQDPHNARHHEEIRKCLARLKLTGIEAKGVVFDKTTGEPFNTGRRVLTILDDYGYREEEDDEGNIAVTHWIRLSDWFWTSLNAGYVRPSDLDYFLVLVGSGNEIAGRLYDLLAAKFFGLFMNRPEREWMSDSTYAKFEYTELCDLLPVVAQTYFSDAKRNLSAAHTRLIGNKKDFAELFGWTAVGDGFIRKFAWQRTKKKQIRWHLCYYPGRRAIAEFKAFREVFRDRLASEQIEMQLQPTASGVSRRLHAPQGVVETVDSPTGQGSAETRSQRENAGTPEADRTMIALGQQLIEREIKPRAAARLATKYPDRISRNVEVFDFLLQKPDHGIKNPPAYLCAAIEENWFLTDPPEGFVSREEQEDERLRKERAEHELLREYETRKQEIIDDVEAVLEIAPEQRVAPMLNAWETTQRKTRRAPSAADRARRQAGYMKNLPSKEKLLADKFRELQTEFEDRAREQGADWRPSSGERE